MTPTARLIALALLPACDTSRTEAPAAPSRDSVAFEEARTKDNGGANSNFDYCDGATLCLLGEGDCDTDVQCDAGLSCVQNNGTNFGFYWTIDFCAGSHCDNGLLDGNETAVDFGGDCGGSCGGTNGDPSFCKPGCECAAGAGDCDTDADCSAGNVCAENVGSSYGLYWTIDVCVPTQCDNGVQDGGETGIDFGGPCSSTCGGTNGDEEGFCSVNCPCGEDQGDCDSDAECQAGLDCLINIGAEVGLDPLDDICQSPLLVTELGAGDLIVTEIMYDPVGTLESGGEWFEVYNNSGKEVNLKGLYVQDTANGTNFTLPADLFMANKEYFVFTRGISAVNGGITPDYDYPNVWLFNNASQDSVILKTALGGTEIDRIVYNPAAGWPLTTQGSMQLGFNNLTADNNVSTNWCISTFPGVPVGGDLGTPGTKNGTCP